jgi:hypothetical protein
MLTPIPLPADDYDRTHSIYAALSSFHAAATSFDAAMDSLVETTNRQHLRVGLLEKRAQRCREWIQKLDKLVESKAAQGGVAEYNVDDAICTVFSPATYEEALQGIEMKIDEVKEDLLLDTQSQSQSHSASDATRSAADAAVKQALIHDAQTDDGEAVPSDLWLDLASAHGVNLGRSIKATDTQRHVPLLSGALTSSSGLCMEEKEYGAILDSLAFSSSTSMNSPVIGVLGSNGRDDESVHSTTSKMSALTMTSTAMSTSGRLTAGQRRRWHQQQQQMRNIKAGVAAAATATVAQSTEKLDEAISQLNDETNAANSNTSSEAKPSTPAKSTTSKNSYSNISAMKGRQQSLSGSNPYLCEVLHDSYGIGTSFKRGLVDCSGFSDRDREALTCIQDLTIFNTTRESHGLATRRAAAERQKQTQTS